MGGAAAGRAGLRPASRRGQFPAQTGDVGFDAFEVGIGAVGIRIIEAAEEAQEIAVDFVAHVDFPEQGRLLQQVLRAGKESARLHFAVRAVAGRFGELRIKDGQFVHVIGGGHLPQQIGGAQGEADDALQVALELDAVQFDVHAGAADHVLHGLDFSCGKSWPRMSSPANWMLRSTWMRVYLAPVPSVSPLF